ncbi:DUF2306 domain-containing protein [Fluviicola chungangensis]|uniref:DUF2306 domain-containing protein n=1 Tax=Fluviicola chungangensis TaxID=2597671 RepID=A0A556N7U4_9FLAO|nr:DUF2306 domain-containing protein [Fluviicola chungangensis]TSJ48244.1 DUF2306 domain-containing protein [Fluviicola chungangensis]
MKKTAWIFFVIGILYASYLLLLLSLPYLEMRRGIDFLKTKQFIYHIKHWRYSFYIHVFTSILIITSGLFQFSKTILSSYPKIHRISGFIYLTVTLLISGPAALVMSFYANGGYPAQTSFVILSILWIGSTFLAYHYVRKKDYERHGKWMVRSYALTLSAVSLRLYSYLFDVFHLRMDPTDLYILLSWLSWTLNLVAAEIFIRRGLVKRLLANR